MNLFAVLLPVILLVGTARAADEVQLQGLDAQKLFSALTRGGAFIDCGMQTCGVMATSVSCSQTVASATSSTCRMTAVTDEGGEPRDLTVQGEAAADVIDVLGNTPFGRCALGGCGVQASEINCTDPNPRQDSGEGSECFVN